MSSYFTENFDSRLVTCEFSDRGMLIMLLMLYLLVGTGNQSFLATSQCFCFLKCVTG